MLFYQTFINNEFLIDLIPPNDILKLDKRLQIFNYILLIICAK